MKKYFLIVLMLFVTVSGFSQTPVIKTDSLTFFYKNKQAKKVAILFSFDNYKTMYHMVKDPYKKDSFFIKIDYQKDHLPIKPGKYYYKMLVDGVYTYDYENPSFTEDPYLGRISFFNLNAPALDYHRGPLKIDPYTYRFFFVQDSYDDHISHVSLVGDFNNWSPYNYTLKQSPDNKKIWYVDVKFSEVNTAYQYMFVVDGKWINDIYNRNKSINQVKQNVSVLNASE